MFDTGGVIVAGDDRSIPDNLTKATTTTNVIRGLLTNRKKKNKHTHKGNMQTFYYQYEILYLLQ